MQIGIVYALVAGLFWGTGPVLVKRGLVNSNVSAATVYQQTAILFTLILLTLFDGNFLNGTISRIAILVFAATGVVGAYLGRTLFVRSVAQIGASRAQSLNSSSPLVTVLLAALFLGERLTPGILAGVLLIVSGVFFITKVEPQKHESAVSRTLTLTSILATICYGIVPVMKKIGTDAGGSPVLGALVMHATGLIFLLTLGGLLRINLKWQKVPADSWFCFVAAGALQAVGSILTLKALIYAPASVVAPIWNAQPIVSFFLARWLLTGIEVVTIRDGMAAVMVVAGVIVLRWA
jgi:drug/metabolite transporter (DMT)-like permease